MAGPARKILQEQIARMRRGEISPEGLPTAFGNALIQRTTQRRQYLAGNSEFPGYDYDLMEQALKRRELEQGPSLGEMGGNVPRDLDDIVVGTGQVLGRMGKGILLHPIESAKFVARDPGRLLDPQAWREAWDQSEVYRTRPPEAAPQKPTSLAMELQQRLAGTVKGYAALLEDPKRRLVDHPLFTALDLLPLYGGAIKGAAAGAKAAGAGRLAAGLEAALPARAAGSALRAAARHNELAAYLERTLRNRKWGREALAQNAREHYEGRVATDKDLAENVLPFVEKAGRGVEIKTGWRRKLPGDSYSKALLEGRAGFLPAATDAAEGAEMGGLMNNAREFIERRSTSPLERERLMKARTHDERALAPLREILEEQLANAGLPAMNKRSLDLLAQNSLAPRPEHAAAVKALSQEIEAQGLRPDFLHDPNAAAPYRQGNVIIHNAVAPEYVPDMAVAQGRRPWDFLTVRPVTAQVGKPFLKQRMGNTGVEMVQDVGEIYQRHAAQVSRAINNLQLLKDIETKYSPVEMAQIERRELLDPDKLERWTRKGYVPWDRDGYLKFYRLEIDITRKVVQRLKEAGATQVSADHVATVLADEFKNALPKKKLSLLGVSKNDKVYMIPQGLANELFRRITPKGNIERFLFNRPLDIWRQLVLGTPRWVVNNLVGNVFLNTLAGVDPADYARAAASFWKRSKLHELIPSEVNRTFVRAETTTRHLPQLAGGLEDAAAVAQKVGGVVKYPYLAVRGVFKAIQASNSKVEEYFRRANYLHTAVPMAKQRARLRLAQQAGRSLTESQAILDELRSFADEVRLHDPVVSGIRERELFQTGPGREAIEKVNEFLFDYSKLSSFERRWFREIEPFYSWYKNILGLTIRLPFRHPNRARILKGLSDIGNDLALDMPNVPDYMRGSVPLGETQGTDPLTGAPATLTRFLNTRGANPLQSVLELGSWPNTLHPLLKALVETAASKDLLTGQPFSRAGAVRDYSTGEYVRLSPSGEMETLPRSGGLKTLLVRLANQTPPLKMALDALAGGRRYDDSFTEAVPAPPRQVKGNLPEALRRALKRRGFDTDTLEPGGAPRAPFNLLRELGKLSGVSTAELNLPRLEERNQALRRRQLSQLFRATGQKDPSGLREAVRQAIRYE